MFRRVKVRRISSKIGLNEKEINNVSFLYNGVIAGNRACLSRSVTLVESKNLRKKEMAQTILSRLLAESKVQDDTFRVGLSGPPGAGKSTFIEAAGKHIIEQEGKLAVFAVDPSSSRTGGSLLGQGYANVAI
jgi:LAO/AO transport system kinase